tara:strand:- start:1164 stop:1412 length:249 start_codon:yes stop_codon:yes gene_type:complete
LSKNGRDTNKEREGITIQKILKERFFIFSMFFVSMYSQIIDNTEISGIDATNPPINELFLLISDTKTITKEEISSFIIVYIN